MKIEIIPDNETKRRTGNLGWTMPEGPISRRIAYQAVQLKGLLHRSMSHEEVAEATELCGHILRSTEEVANLEHAPLEVCHG